MNGKRLSLHRRKGPGGSADLKKGMSKEIEKRSQKTKELAVKNAKVIFAKKESSKTVSFAVSKPKVSTA